MDQTELACAIVEAVGGEGNINSVGHCMTRLRFTLKNMDLADDDAVKKVKGVMGVARAAGQYQIILGTGVVDDYCDAILRTFTFVQESYSDIEEGVEYVEEKLNITPSSVVSAILGYISGSITPWLGCIMGSLLISAILSIFTSLGLLTSGDGTYVFFKNVSDACLYSLPVLVGFTAAERIGTNKYMGALLGAILIYPSLSAAVSDGTATFFGMSISGFTYTSTIIPILLAVWLLKYVEMLAKKVCPQVIYIFGVTLIELIITVPLVYLVIGPIGVIVATAISDFIMFIYNNASFLAVGLAGAVMPVAVMGGVHYALFPSALLMMTEIGYDPIIHPALMAYNMSLAGACLAYGLRMKDPDKRSMGISSFVSGVVGLSEAGLFSVLLENKRVFATTVISILITGCVTGLVGYKAYVALSQSIFAIPAAADGGFNMAACTISLVTGLVLGFLLTYFFGGLDKEEE